MVKTSTMNLFPIQNSVHIVEELILLQYNYSMVMVLRPVAAAANWDLKNVAAPRLQNENLATGPDPWSSVCLFLLLQICWRSNVGSLLSTSILAGFEYHQLQKTWNTWGNNVRTFLYVFILVAWRRLSQVQPSDVERMRDQVDLCCNAMIFVFLSFLSAIKGKETKIIRCHHLVAESPDNDHCHLLFPFC